MRQSTIDQIKKSEIDAAKRKLNKARRVAQDALVYELQLWGCKDENYENGWDELVEAYTAKEIKNYLNEYQITDLQEAKNSFQGTWDLRREYANQFIDPINY